MQTNALEYYGAKQIIVLAENRTPNGVDLLKQQIAALERKVLEVQRSCLHDVRLLGALPPLQESEVRGVYFLSTCPWLIGVKCLKCSREIMLNSPEGRLVCPRCLGKLEWLYQPGHFFSADSWASKFQGSAERYDCTECGLKYVWPEYSLS